MFFQDLKQAGEKTQGYGLITVSIISWSDFDNFYLENRTYKLYVLGQKSSLDINPNNLTETDLVQKIAFPSFGQDTLQSPKFGMFL